MAYLCSVFVHIFVCSLLSAECALHELAIMIFSVTVTLAHSGDTQDFEGYPVADVYTGIFILTLISFQLSYPFWTSLKRIAIISCINDVCTDGPMIFMMAQYHLYNNNSLCGIAIFVNICIMR
eukprot:COSAG01_NODE_614_length_14830_cov_87.820572_13_plen_123_part_00